MKPIFFGQMLSNSYRNIEVFRFDAQTLKLKPETTGIPHTLQAAKSEDKKAGFDFLGY